MAMPEPESLYDRNIKISLTFFFLAGSCDSQEFGLDKTERNKEVVLSNLNQRKCKPKRVTTPFSF